MMILFTRLELKAQARDSLEDMKKKPSKEVEKEKNTDLFDDEDDIL